MINKIISLTIIATLSIVTTSNAGIMSYAAANSAKQEARNANEKIEKLEKRVEELNDKLDKILNKLEK